MSVREEYASRNPFCPHILLCLCRSQIYQFGGASFCALTSDAKLSYRVANRPLPFFTEQLHLAGILYKAISLFRKQHGLTSMVLSLRRDIKLALALQTLR